MNRIPLVRHRTVNQIRAKYRACRHPVEKVRWHAVWLLARTDEPRTPAQVAGVVGLSDVTVRAVLHRWNASGPDGLADGRRGNGSEPRLTPRRRDALYAAVQRRPPDGGVAVPANVRLHFLPACTPELQPVEPLWALVREAVANDTFDRLADLRRRVARRCRRLAGDRLTVLGAIGFHWAVNLEA